MRQPLSQVALVAVLALAACGTDDVGTADSTSQAPLGTPSASAVGATTGAPATGAPATGAPATGAPATGADADLAAVTSYELTMDKVDKYLAAQRNLALRMRDMSAAEREALKTRMESGGDQSESLEQTVRRIESEPVLNGAVRDAGLSAREYTLLTVSMMQSAMAAGVLKSRPRDNQDSLVQEMQANLRNVRFIQQNEAELQRKQQAMAAELQRLGVPTGG